MSESESSSMPNLVEALSARASLPSAKSQSAAQNRSTQERSNCPSAAATMPRNPNAMLASVTRFGTTYFAATAIHATDPPTGFKEHFREDFIALSADVRSDRSLPGGAHADRLSAGAWGFGRAGRRQRGGVRPPAPTGAVARARRAVGAAARQARPARLARPRLAAGVPVAVARARRRAGGARRDRRGAGHAQRSGGLLRRRSLRARGRDPRVVA